MNRAVAALSTLILLMAPVGAAAQATKTSTPTEDRGRLRRAPMPEGGAPDPFEGNTIERPTPEEGLDDPLPRAPMPLGGAPDGFSGYPPEAETSPEVRDEAPAEPDSQAEPGPVAEPGPTTPAFEAEPAPPSADPPPPPFPDPDRAQRRFGDFADGLSADYGITINWNGFLRLVLEAIENDSKAGFTGRTDGFRIANARIGIRAAKDDFSAYISADAAAGERESFNDPNQQFAFRPRDLLLRYRLAQFGKITLGRFKVPFDLGQLETTAYRIFIDIPLESRGVLPTQGFEVEGLGQGRQLGAMVHSERIGLDPDGFDIGYAVAVTNGRTLGFELNDNDRIAAFARLSLHWADYVQLNVAGFVDSRTIADVSDPFDQDITALEVSIVAQYRWFDAEVQVLYQRSEFEADARPDVDALGGHAQLAITYAGFQVAYRYAYFNPVFADNEVMEHTAGLAYQLNSFPLRFVLNGTLAFEDLSVRADNHRLAFLTQFVF